MTPQDVLQAARRELAQLWERPVAKQDCDYCGRPEWHAVDDNEEPVCLQCAKNRVESMAEAVRGIGGVEYLAWKEKRQAEGARFADD